MKKSMKIVTICVITLILVGVIYPKNKEVVEGSKLGVDSEVETVHEFIKDEISRAYYINDSPPKGYSEYYSFDTSDQESIRGTKYTNINGEYVGRSGILFKAKDLEIDFKYIEDGEYLIITLGDKKTSNSEILKLHLDGKPTDPKNISKIYYAYSEDQGM